MRKKWFVYVLAACMTISVMGCGMNTDADKDALPTSEESGEDSGKTDSTKDNEEDDVENTVADEEIAAETENTAIEDNSEAVSVKKLPIPKGILAIVAAAKEAARKSLLQECSQEAEESVTENVESEPVVEDIATETVEAETVAEPESEPVVEDAVTEAVEAEAVAEPVVVDKWELSGDPDDMPRRRRNAKTLPPVNKPEVKDDDLGIIQPEFGF